MTRRTIFYLLVVVAIFGGTYLFNYFEKRNNLAPLTLDAKKPDLLLNNSAIYIKEHAKNRSVQQLSEAIQAIRDIEVDVDDQSRLDLETAITDLEMVRDEILHDELVEEDLENAFTNALNTLTLAELRLSEALIRSGDGEDALVALKYGMYHLSNTLKYASGKKRDYEIHVYQELDSLFEHGHFTKKEMLERLDRMIIELDTLIEK